MKKFFKWFVVVTVSLIVFSIVFGLLQHESRPVLTQQGNGDALAEKMLKALGEKAFQETRFLEWSFRNGAHKYLWDKEKHVVMVSWEDVEVELHLKDPEKSKIISMPKNAQAIEYILKARQLFNNDSFWLVAPYKIFDPGTTRSEVQLENGHKGLFVTYASGGDTPGDSYLWHLNEYNIPVAYQMWVKIIPIGGIKATWEDWISTESGALLPQNHRLGPLRLDMGKVKGYN